MNEIYLDCTIRFSLSLYTTPRDIETTLEAVATLVAELREVSSWPS